MQSLIVCVYVCACDGAGDALRVAALLAESPAEEAINAADVTGRTALHAAAQSNSNEVRLFAVGFFVCVV